MVTAKQVKTLLQKTFQDIGIESSESARQTELIVQYVTGWDLAYQLINENEKLADDKYEEVERILAQRKQRMPLQYCLGLAPFMGLMLNVEPGVLIPRTDTETLVVVAMNKLNKKQNCLVADIGVGSGAIAIALAKLCPDIKVIGLDISQAAARIAKKNVVQHCLLNQVQIIQGDWKTNLPDNLDAILTNPPYISADDFQQLAPEITNWEPQEALIGSDLDGLGFYRELSVVAGAHLLPGGFIAVEIPDKSENAIRSIFLQAGWRQIETIADVNGLPRVILATHPEPGFSKA